MKTIDYGHPSSDYAKECGFYSSGCWCVSYASPNKRKKKLEVKGFSSYGKAFKFAEALAEEYSCYSSNVFHAKNNFVNAPKEVREFHQSE